MIRLLVVLYLILVATIIFFALAYKMWWADSDLQTDLEDMPANGVILRLDRGGGPR